MARDLEDAALGCLLGACIGDAAGATLEFLGPSSREDVDKAISMCGGGFFRLAPGQITDDAELALSLADALSRSRSFDVETVAHSYARWIDSGPFDVGTTTRNSIGAFRSAGSAGYAAAMTRAASENCMDSKANGSLMRISPLAIWGHRLSDDALARCAAEDSLLSHPHESCRHAVASYVIAVAALLRNPGAREEAFSRASAWAEANANEEVRGWLRDAESLAPIDFLSHIGFVRIALVNAFQHLLRAASFEDTIRETLAEGGDTDTNACIAGALVGAAAGASAIPESMKNAVLECDTREGRSRPEYLHSRRVPALVTELLTAAR